MKRLIVMAASLLLALSLAAPVAFAQSGQSSQPSSGQAGQLVAAWWQWALEEAQRSEPDPCRVDRSEHRVLAEHYLPPNSGLTVSQHHSTQAET